MKKTLALTVAALFAAAPVALATTTHAKDSVAITKAKSKAKGKKKKGHKAGGAAPAEGGAAPAEGAPAAEGGH